jgi:hypothetical protein
MGHDLDTVERVIETIIEQADSDDDQYRQAVKLICAYEGATDRDRGLINYVTICLTGYSIPKLLALTNNPNDYLDAPFPYRMPDARGSEE